MKLWGGRFASAASATFESFSESLSFDRRLLAADLRGSEAYAHALVRAGVLSEAECATVVDAFRQIGREAEHPSFFDNSTDEDVHTLVIRKLRERTGGLAGKIHTGRSRNEQVALDVRIWVREACDLALAHLDSLLAALLDLAERYRDAIIPGYTHLRRAQAVLWPHYLLSYFEMFDRDRERVRDARRRTNVMPLGSGALAGSAFALGRDEVAHELEFDSVTRNSMDAASDRDFVLDFLYAASTTTLHLSRMAEDWILYSSTEFGWLELSDEVTSGSSLMPQKKNPDSLELIRGKTGRIAGNFVSLLMILKGLPSTYNRDMQEDKELLFDASDQLIASLRMAEAVTRSVSLHADVALAAAERSWLVATDLAEALARSGVPFHDAHNLVGRLVLESEKKNKLPRDWNGESLSAFDPRFLPEMAALLDPAEGLKTREIFGGTGPRAVASALCEARDRLTSTP